MPEQISAEAHITVAAPLGADGYRPIAESMATWALIAGSPSIDQFRLVLAAARRLDTAHRQLGRVREGIADAGTGSPFARRRLLDVVGDAEMAMIALNKAITIARSLSGKYRIGTAIPRLLQERAAFVTRMRDHYEHIEDRAIGRTKLGVDQQEAARAFEFATLVRDRSFSDGVESLGVDGEATELIIAVRDYLVACWNELVARANPPAPRSST